MTLNATSYFAGIGTVVAALAVGFGGAILITGPNDKIVSQNRLQQVMSHPSIESSAQVVSVEKSVRTDVMPTASSATPTVASAQAATTVNPAPSDSPLPALTKQAVQTAAIPEEPHRELVQDTDRASRVRFRQAEVKRAVDQENQRKAVERQKRQQEIDTATVAVRRMPQDNRSRQIVQVESSSPVRFGFFGQDD